VSLLVAVVMLALLGLGGLAAVPFALAEATRAQQLDDHLGAMGEGVLLVVGGALAAVGLVAHAGAVGMWRCRAWGWLAGVLATGLILVGTLAAIGVSASEPGLAVGGLLAAAGLLACAWPGTRRACTL
jgi:hypothetical protein